MQIEAKCERNSASITPNLLRAPQRSSRWNSTIWFKDYSCGLLLRCATIIAATPIPFTNMMVGSQPWLDTLDPQIKNAMVELNKFRSVLSRLGSTRDAVGMFMELRKTISGVIEHWLACMDVIWFKTAVANGVFSCIDIVYKVGRFPSFDDSSIINSFSSISRVKTKPTAQLQALRRAPEY